MAKDGTTLVEATTGQIDGAAGAGNIRHVTTTATTVDGVQQPTAAYNNLKAGGYWSHTYTGFARNEPVKVDTNVTDLDPRTDVVTTLDTVKLRPDLSAVAVTGPQKAYPNTPVTFTAPVRELNGDVGAHADCILSVDGQQVDQSLGIWVDAGDTVSCTFQTSFATTGTKHVSVSVTNVVPGDWDTANNSATATIQIVDPVVHLNTYAWAETWGWSNNGNQTYSAPNEQDDTTYTNSQSETQGYIGGYTYGHGFAFPVQQMSASVTGDSATIFQQSIAAFSPAYTYGSETCSYSYAPGTSASVCSDGEYTSSSLSFNHFSTTYYSKTVSTTCNYAGCSTYSHVNDDQSSGDGQTFTLGNVDQFTIKFGDAAGTSYTGTTAPATAQGYSYSEPYSGCWTYWDYSPNEQWCETGTYSQENRYVNAYGSGS